MDELVLNVTWEIRQRIVETTPEILGDIDSTTFRDVLKHHRSGPRWKAQFPRFRESLRLAGAAYVPLAIDSMKRLLDGFRRWDGLTELGLIRPSTVRFVEYDGFPDEDATRTWIRARSLDPKSLSRAETEKVVNDELDQDERRYQRELQEKGFAFRASYSLIGLRLGVS